MSARIEFGGALSRESFARGLALFLGCFSLLNLAGSFHSAGFDANLWWIDLRLLPLPGARAFELSAAVLLVSFAVCPSSSGWRRWLTLGCTAGLCLAAIANAIEFYLLMARGRITSSVPVPLSLFVAAGLGMILSAAAQVRTRPVTRRSFLWTIGLCAGFVLLFPLLQMFCFGRTDYRRPADVAVVLGARVYADGRPSDALADRVRTACQLYRSGLVKKLVVSGGPGDGAVHETETMKRMAVTLGVRPEDILVDKLGLNTRATARNTEPLMEQLQASRVMVVSHFYHLPRIKLTYQQDGWEVFTVPAKESYILRQLPFNMLREIAAFWAYYLEPFRSDRLG